MSLKFRTLLSLPDKGVSLTNDPLARLFRKMLLELRMDEFHADKRATEYVNDPSNRIPNNPAAQSSARGNLFKELANERMTFNVYYKGLKFLGPQTTTLCIEVKWNESRTTKHFIEMLINPKYYPHGTTPTPVEKAEKMVTLLDELNGRTKNNPNNGIIVVDKATLKHNGTLTTHHIDVPPVGDGWTTSEGNIIIPTSAAEPTITT